MSRLPAKLNSRQDKFARNLAKGMTLAAAYVDAGYQPHPANPTRLRENERVRARVEELQKRAAIDTGITIQSITADLAEVVKEAAALPQSAGTLNARRAALMDIATLNGLVVTRSETGKPGDFSIADPDCREMEGESDQARCVS
jgi:alkanesulfonate monooxygenase SsuD/methylene tetrahydromethanopterin reductase-like flavin-dependent oxidoreductase (luciferase family)